MDIEQKVSLSLNRTQLSEVIELLNQSRTSWEDGFRPWDCLDIQRAGYPENGRYMHKVYPDDDGDPFFGLL